MPATVPKRPSPTVSATQFVPGTRRKGNDGAFWEVAATAGGVRRWRRVASSSSRSQKATTAPRSSSSSSSSSQYLTIVLPIVLDDFLGHRAKAASRNTPGVELPTPPPPDAASKALVRRKVAADDFEFGALLFTGLPLVAAGHNDKNSRYGFFLSSLFKSKNERNNDEDVVPARMVGKAKLVEGKAYWSVLTRWEYARGDDGGGREVDVPALLSELQGQMSDGWGEGVSQRRFGPRVIEVGRGKYRPGKGTFSEDDWGDDAFEGLEVHGRFSFNLTTVDARVTTP